MSDNYGGDIGLEKKHLYIYNYLNTGPGVPGTQGAFQGPITFATWRAPDNDFCDLNV